MGVSLADAADWDLVEYAKTLPVYNARQKVEGQETIIDSEPPPAEWMMADDYRQSERGVRVN